MAELIAKKQIPFSTMSNDKSRSLIHFGLRGMDNLAFRSSRYFGFEPLKERTIVSCDDGADHNIHRNKGRKVYTVESMEGMHRDWSTDDLDKITSIPGVQKILNSINGTPLSIIPFKNTTNIDSLRSDKIHILAPPHNLVHFFDSKMNLIPILTDAKVDIIPGEIISKRITNFRELKRKYGRILVAQSDFGSGGSGTFFIETERVLSDLFKRLDVDSLKISKYIEGPSFNGQACVIETSAGPKTLVFTPSFQIIGVPEISATDTPAYYCGNDYTNSVSFLGKEGVDKYRDSMQKIGNYMGSKGWKGIFGIDFIFSAKEQKVYIVEINPRMQSSTSFLHCLQETNGDIGIMDFHIASFVREPFPEEFVNIQEYCINEYCGSHILINNIMGSDVQVNGTIYPGRYLTNDGFLKHIKFNSWTVPSKNDLVITCGVPETGTLVENRATILKLYSRAPALDDSKKSLTDIFKKIALQVYDSLDLRKI